MKTVEIHDTVRVSSVNDRHDSIVYVFRNDTVLIDRWHKIAKTDTVYQNKIEYVHDTVRVMEKQVSKAAQKQWTFKDELKTLLAGLGITALLLLLAKWKYERNNI